MKFIYANWKMAQPKAGIDEFFENFSWKKFAGAEAELEIGIFPSYVYLSYVRNLAQKKNLEKNFVLGAQDLSTEKSGAFTGEISGTMLKELSVTHVLIGHSERRQRAQETSESLRAKLERARENSLTPVFCLGESLEQRKAGKVEAILSEQLSVLSSFSAPFILAYEPIWAIGTGLTASSQEIEAAHHFLKSKLSTQCRGVLYGGSVKPQNAAEILGLASVDGLLVGGASLKPGDFGSIVEAAV